VQQPIPMQGGFYYHPDRAAEIIGLHSTTVWKWARTATTSYAYPLRIVKHGGHYFIDETDVRVLEKVHRDFPLRKGGPGTRQRREAMCSYATRLHAAATPSG
jgi:hypothetical protein